MDYKTYNDSEILSYIRENNEEANEVMFSKYKPLISRLSSKLYPKFMNKGLELSDLIQEGMVGLSYAINSYKDSKDTTFYTYAKTCIERSMLSLLVGTNRLKNKILNDSLSIDNTTDEYSIIDILGDDSINPLNIIIKEEDEQELFTLAKEILTDKEFQVFELKVSGFDYKEIADTLESDPKTVDNAIQRIKNKFKKRLKQI